MIGLLFGSILCIWGVKCYLAASENMKIIKRLGSGAQTLIIKILDKETRPKKRRYYYILDKSVEELCFKGEITVEGITRCITVIAPPQTETGKIYMMRGWFYPTSKLFLPDTDSLYYFNIKIRFWIPKLLPKVVVIKNPLDEKH